MQKTFTPNALKYVIIVKHTFEKVPHGVGEGLRIYRKAFNATWVEVYALEVCQSSERNLLYQTFRFGGIPEHSAQPTIE
jgi:hypothetical protein